MFEDFYDKTLALATIVFALLASFGLKMHPTKGHFLPILVGDHLGMILDFEKGEFRAPMVKLKEIAALARGLLCRAASHKRWVSVKALASLAGKARFLHLAIPVAMFFPHRAPRRGEVREELVWHRQGLLPANTSLGVVDESPQAPQRSPICKAIENAYIRCDSSNYGWGAVLNNRAEARCFWTMPYLDEHITFKELKAVRCTIKACFPEIKGNRLLLHEDNQSMIGVLTHLISKFPTMMCELRKLFLLTDTYDIKIWTKYIRSAANVLADNLSRVTDNSDWQLAPRKFRHFIRNWSTHTIDQIASSTNKQVPRYNSKWRDGKAEAVDSLHLSDQEWRRENNWCNPPWELLDDLTLKLRQSGAIATVIAPYWPKNPWFLHLTEMCTESVDMPPSHDLSSSQQQQGHAGVGPSARSVVAFRLPLRPGCY
jgi:hypothetical protein